MTTGTGCDAEQSTCVCPSLSLCVSVCARNIERNCCNSHAYLRQGFAEGGCPYESALHGNWPRKTEKEIQTGMLFLSSATCVSVTVGFVPPQSLTHMDYVYLKQKANTSHILCEQSGAQTQHIFLFVDSIF